MTAVAAEARVNEPSAEIAAGQLGRSRVSFRAGTPAIHLMNRYEARLSGRSHQILSNLEHIQNARKAEESAAEAPKPRVEQKTAQPGGTPPDLLGS
jgi:hypothetical protein